MEVNAEVREVAKAIVEEQKTEVIVSAPDYSIDTKYLSERYRLEKLDRIEKALEDESLRGDKKAVELLQDVHGTLRVTLVPCLWCGNLKWKYPSQIAKHENYCSIACRLASAKAKSSLHCIICGVEFHRNKSGQKCCSHHCARTASLASMSNYKKLARVCQEKNISVCHPETVRAFLLDEVTRHWRGEAPFVRPALTGDSRYDKARVETCALCGKTFYEPATNPDTGFCMNCEDIMRKSLSELFPTMDKLFSKRHSPESPRPVQPKRPPEGRGLRSMVAMAEKENGTLMSWKKTPVSKWTPTDLWRWLKVSCAERKIVLEDNFQHCKWMLKYLLLHEDNGDGIRGVAMVHIVEILSGFLANYSYFCKLFKWVNLNFECKRMMSYWTAITHQLTYGRHSNNLHRGRTYTERERRLREARFKSKEKPPGLLVEPPPLRRDKRFRITDWRHVPEESWHLRTVWQFIMECLRAKHIPCKDFKRSQYANFSDMGLYEMSEIIGVAKWLVVNFNELSSRGDWTIPFSATSFVHLYKELRVWWLDRLSRGKIADVSLEDVLEGFAAKDDENVIDLIAKSCRLSIYDSGLFKG